MFTLQVLNSDDDVNNFHDIGSLKFYAGEDFKVVLRIIDSNTGMRHVFNSATTFSIDLLKSDGTFLNKTPGFSFTGDPSDQSIVDFDITAAESNDIISQDLKLVITEGSETRIATLKSGLSKVVTGDC